MNEKWKTVLISVLTPSGIISVISLTVLWGYFSRLDRLDVFFEVMDIKSIFALVFCAVIISLIFLMLVFFVISILMTIVIPQDVSNLPNYDKIKSNFLILLMISGLFPMVFVYFFYYVFNVGQTVKDYSAFLSLLSIGLMSIISSGILNRKYIEDNLSIKNKKVRFKVRCQFYLSIPLSIAFLAHLQVFPLEIIFRNIHTSDDKVSFWAVAGIAFISYMVYFLTLLPGAVYLRMGTTDKVLKKFIAFFMVSMAVLLMISTRITVIPVMFTHAVIKLSGISDFSPHSYIIKDTEYPEQFFTSPLWNKAPVKPGEYYAVRAVALFNTNKFILICPREIIKSYRESWKFNPWDVEYDNSVRLKLQKDAAYCVPVSASAVKRWDVPLK